jgi:hypothetical protein
MVIQRTRLPWRELPEWSYSSSRVPAVLLYRRPGATTFRLRDDVSSSIINPGQNSPVRVANYQTRDELISLRDEGA